MTLKELSQLYYLNREIEMDKQRLEKLKARVSAPGSPNYDGMPKSPSHENCLDRYIAEIVDLEAIISAKITQCLTERNALERYIADIPDSLTRQVFTLRFVHGFSWSKVSRAVGNNTSDSVKKICYRYINKKT